MLVLVVIPPQLQDPTLPVLNPELVRSEASSCVVFSTSKAGLDFESSVLETAENHRGTEKNNTTPFFIQLFIVSLAPFLKLTKSPASEDMTEWDAD